MEFWGAEIKPGQALKVQPGEDFVLHISQASLGESKKGSVTVLLSLKVNEQKFVLGTLSHEKFPQLSFDLVFDDEFELSHNWKNGSIYVVGYKSMRPEEDYEFDSDEFDSDEEAPQLVPAAGLTNEKPGKTAEIADAKAKATNIIFSEKPGKTAEIADAKAKATKNASSDVPKVAEEDSDEGSDEDDDSDDDETDDDESDEDQEKGLDSEKAMLSGESDDESDSEDDDSDDDDESDEDDDESDEDDDEDDEEETPKKVESSKKRPAAPANQTPVSNKGKFTPEKKEVKKASQTSTPHPAKQAKKAPGNKPQSQTPVSNGKNSNKKGKHGGK